ncbi:IclR family transcriptional regulator [Alsobacter sp. SYSU M60028]|uniref:IclR family transcriptional regulator n=1 Tax=Alsobacter ponti TaxID=2962936 RepID=A0ABT1LJV3_9HYPH|nr:IclR family transcriptional regulator [Alsobacter ponti]MCP8941015.1 IclR family transcriptional regulator [Alsobacter ponti]
MTIISTAADVLRCFSQERQELTLTDVVALRGAPKSSTSRLLRAMREAGLLETVGNSKRYRPSLLLFQLGQLYRAGSSLMARAEDLLSDVVEEAGHSGYVSIRDGREVMGLRYFAGRHALRVGTPIGRRLLAQASATGRSLLARLPDDAVRALFADEFEIPSATAPQTVDDLLRRLAEVRRTGLSESWDESNRGVGALAVAVADPQTEETVSLCVTYPVATITADEKRIIANRLLAGARSIATVMGDRVCHALRAGEPAMQGT